MRRRQIKYQPSGKVFQDLRSALGKFLRRHEPGICIAPCLKNILPCAFFHSFVRDGRRIEKLDRIDNVQIQAGDLLCHVFKLRIGVDGRIYHQRLPVIIVIQLVIIIRSVRIL